MNQTAQPSLNMRVAARTVFVGIDAARASLGVDAESVVALVENGELLWTFNIGLGEDRRELRFWARQIIELSAGSDSTKTWPLARVIQSILGGHENISRGEIERQWICSSQHIGRLIQSNDLQLILPKKISRASLERFLSLRWCGAWNGGAVAATTTLNPGEPSAPAHRI